ncbi:MAG: hypothetical protein RBT03_00820 [Kiritimatiellia bacterium]|nr:hypothetical protein [Kiritimatiellia bacterium]
MNLRVHCGLVIHRIITHRDYYAAFAAARQVWRGRGFGLLKRPEFSSMARMDVPRNRWRPGAGWRWVMAGAGIGGLAWATHHGPGPWLDPPIMGLVALGLGTIFLLLYVAPMWRDTQPAPRSALATRWPAAGLLLGLLILYVVSSAITDNWFFPTEWKVPLDPTTGLLQRSAARCLILALALALGFKPLLRTSWGLALAWVYLAGLAVTHLYAATGFDMIYRVDSPAFVYRFWTFQHLFPRPDGYDPFWNAGMPITAIVASGVWSVGLWLLPFLQWIPAEHLYTPFVAVFFLGLLPLLAWASLRWVGASHRAAWIAALLALAPTQRYWVHLLHYGTSPALFAMSMALPLAALSYRFLYLEPRPRPTTLLLLILMGFTFLAWPGSLIVAVPLGLVLLGHSRQFLPGKWKWLLGVALLLLLLLLPLALVPLRHSTIGGFMAVSARQTVIEHLYNGWGVLGHNLRGTHPLILIFGFVGGFLCLPRPVRRFFAPLALLLLLISGWGEEVKKILQTERLIIPAALVAIVPASLWVDRLIDRALATPARRSLRGAALRTGVAWAVALLLIGGYQGAKAWNGKGLAPFHAQPESNQDLVEWLSEHVPEGGRVLFAGRAVHGYGGAKIAALPLFTGREMMAADFYGFSPKLVEYEYPPREFRYDGPDVMFSFMDLHNVTHIVTWHDYWKETLRGTPRYYRPVHEIGRVAIFETQRWPSLFLEGRGTVAATFNRLEVELDHPQDRIVIKYNWTPGWQATPGATLFPCEVGRGITFIGVEPGTNRHVTLRYRP